MEPGDVAEFKRGTPVARKDVVEGDVPVGTGGGKPACFHNGSNREGKAVVAGSGAHAGFADSRAIPVWLSGSLSIHADDSILLQKIPVFVFEKEAGIHSQFEKRCRCSPCVHQRPANHSHTFTPFHRGAGENCWTTGLPGGIGEGNRIEAEAV